MEQYHDIVTLARQLTLPGAGISQFGARLAKIPLLGRDEELELATLIQAGLQEEDRLKKLPPQRRATVQAKAVRILTAGSEARHRLVFHNLRLAYWACLISMNWLKEGPIRDAPLQLLEEDQWGGKRLYTLRKFAGNPLPFSDRVQRAIEALYVAAEKYIPHRKTKFTSFAAYYLYYGLFEAFVAENYRDESTASGRDDARRLELSQRRLSRLTGHEPSEALLGADTNLSPFAVSQGLKVSALHPRQALEELTPEWDEGPVRGEERLWDSDAPNAEDIAFRRHLQRVIYQLLERNFDEREAYILRARYGLDDGRMKTLDEVAKPLGVTRERVRQIEYQAMQKLRSIATKIGLQEYLVDEPEWPWRGVGEITEPRRRRQVITVENDPYRYPRKVRLWHDKYKAPRPESA
jgi:RNA polymerase sigma factor (sigma-70 family)